MKTYWLISYSILVPKAVSGGAATFTWSFYIYASYQPSIKQCKIAVLGEAHKPSFTFGYEDIGINSIQNVGTIRPELSEHQAVVYSDDLPIEEA